METWKEIVRDIDDRSDRMKKRNKQRLEILRELNAKGRDNELDYEDIRQALDSLAETAKPVD